MPQLKPSAGRPSVSGGSTVPMRMRPTSGRCSPPAQPLALSVIRRGGARPSTAAKLKSLTLRHETREYADDGGDASGMYNGPPVILPAPPASRARLRYRIWQTPPAQTREPQHWAPEVQKPSYQQQRES